jgi:hypothetical protein
LLSPYPHVFSKSARFSHIHHYVITRNEALDSLSRGHSLGTIPLDNERGRTRLRLGRIDTGEKVERAGFRIGAEGLKEGRRYI